MIVYKATHRATGRVYVGQTVRPLGIRISQHAYRNRTWFEKAVRYHGRKAFDWEIVDSATTLDELNRKEIEWIAKLDCREPKGFNLTAGGLGSLGISRPSPRGFAGKKHTDGTKLKIRQAALGKKHPWLAERNRTEAQRHAASQSPGPETRRKMSEARKLWWERQHSR